jgi:hypothetical protein
MFWLLDIGFLHNTAIPDNLYAQLITYIETRTNHRTSMVAHTLFWLTAGLGQSLAMAPITISHAGLIINDSKSPVFVMTGREVVRSKLHEKPDISCDCGLQCRLRGSATHEHCDAAIGKINATTTYYSDGQNAYVVISS